MSVVLCRLQQRLETRIRNRLGFSDPSGDARGSTAGLLEDRQRRWDELDREVGYSRARAAELQAVEAEEELVEAVSSTPAQSMRGVVAKLKVIVGTGQSAGDMASFPWPQIQSVLTDLRTLSESGHVEQPPGDGWPCERPPGGGGHGPDDDVCRLGMSATTNKAGSGNWGRRR